MTGADIQHINRRLFQLNKLREYYTKKTNEIQIADERWHKAKASVMALDWAITILEDIFSEQVKKPCYTIPSVKREEIKNYKIKLLLPHGLGDSVESSVDLKEIKIELGSYPPISAAQFLFNIIDKIDEVEARTLKLEER